VTGRLGSRDDRGGNCLTCSRKEKPSKVENHRAVGRHERRILLRSLCGGRLHRWLTLWVSAGGGTRRPGPGGRRVDDSRAILPRTVHRHPRPRHDGPLTMVLVPWKSSHCDSGGRRRSLSRYASPSQRPLPCGGVHLRWRSATRRAVRKSWGGKIAGVQGSVGQDHHEGDPAARAWREVRVLKSE